MRGRGRLAVVDNILQSKKLPALLGGVVTRLFGQNTDAIVNFAFAGVALISSVDAIGQTPERSHQQVQFGLELRDSRELHPQLPFRTGEPLLDGRPR